VTTTSYVALSATHLACMGLSPADPPIADAEPANGVLVPGPGLNMKSILDGTSRTIIICETNEAAINSWYDGTVAWTVGTNPNASHQPVHPNNQINFNGTGRWVFPSGTKNPLGLDYGGPGERAFAPRGKTPAQTQAVAWGPSSVHPGKVVMHLACDGSVHAITTDIDPDVYLELITRAAREPVCMCEPGDSE
jgi:hypothetical protein